MVERFVYSDKIEEIKPLTLNMVLWIENGQLLCEFRKKISVNEANKDFFKKFFSASLAGKPIKIDAQVVFRDEVKSALTLKKFNLLDININIKKEEIEKELK
jgi:hypothetical protein